jgi:hypothetical protein
MPAASAFNLFKPEQLHSIKVSLTEYEGEPDGLSYNVCFGEERATGATCISPL